MNVQIVSGTGSTNGNPNGKGNLIVGCNTTSLGQTRVGSHYIVVGDEHEYTGSGGFVVGWANKITADNATVTGGNNNTVGNDYASVSGGSLITASGELSSVNGGTQNVASGRHASVSGGRLNTANGPESSISGGASLIQPATNGWAAGTAAPGNTIVGDFESP